MRKYCKQRIKFYCFLLLFWLASGAGDPSAFIWSDPCFFRFLFSTAMVYKGAPRIILFISLQFAALCTSQCKSVITVVPKKYHAKVTAGSHSAILNATNRSAMSTSPHCCPSHVSFLCPNENCAVSACSVKMLHQNAASFYNSNELSRPYRSYIP